jgi:hypothetical protein
LKRESAARREPAIQLVQAPSELPSPRLCPKTMSRGALAPGSVAKPAASAVRLIAESRFGTKPRTTRGAPGKL